MNSGLEYNLKPQLSVFGSSYITADAVLCADSRQAFTVYYYGPCSVPHKRFEVALKALHHLESVSAAASQATVPYIPKIAASGYGTIHERDKEPSEVYAVIAEKIPGRPVCEVLGSLSESQKIELFSKVTGMVNELISQDLATELRLSLYSVFVNDGLQSLKIPLSQLTPRAQKTEFTPPEALTVQACDDVNKPSAGAAAAVFQLGVFLFEILADYAPHFRADYCDEYYSELYRGNLSSYWEKIGKIFTFNEPAKDLLAKMMAKDPIQRISLDDIHKHPLFRVV